MKKIGILTLFLLLVLFPLANAQVGIGLTSYWIPLYGSIGDSRTNTIGVMNPSNYDMRARIYFECRNCVSDFKIFGIKFGEIIEPYTAYFTLEEEEVYVPARAAGSSAVPVSIHFEPKLFYFKYLKLFTPNWINFFVRMVNPSYKGSFLLPYPAILIGEKRLEGSLVAEIKWSSFGTLGVTPSVGARVEVKVRGMPFGSFLVLVIAFLIAIFLVVKRVGLIEKVKRRFVRKKEVIPKVKKKKKMKKVPPKPKKKVKKSKKSKKSKKTKKSGKRSRGKLKKKRRKTKKKRK